jgi:hypothetical protein
MGALTLGNADKQNTVTVIRTENPSAQGNAVQVLNRGPNAGAQGNVRLGANARYSPTYTTQVSGLDEDALSEFGERILSRVTAPAEAGSGNGGGLAGIIGERIADNVEQGKPSLAGKLGLGTIVIIVAGFAALAFVFFHRRKKG